MRIYETSAFSFQSPSISLLLSSEESFSVMRYLHGVFSRIRHFGLVWLKASNMVEKNEKRPLLLLFTILKQQSTSPLIVSLLKQKNPHFILVSFSFLCLRPLEFLLTYSKEEFNFLLSILIPIYFYFNS